MTFWYLRMIFTFCFSKLSSMMSNWIIDGDVTEFWELARGDKWSKSVFLWINYVPILLLSYMLLLTQFLLFFNEFFWRLEERLWRVRRMPITIITRRNYLVWRQVDWLGKSLRSFRSCHLLQINIVLLGIKSVLVLIEVGDYWGHGEVSERCGLVLVVIFNTLAGNNLF